MSSSSVCLCLNVNEMLLPSNINIYFKKNAVVYDLFTAKMG